MILAAGLGTRLRPLTYETPKALIGVGGRPMLDRVARRLVELGATRLVINVSPHADMIRDFIREVDAWNVDVRISEEHGGPLETGGGLKKAAPLFEREGPILIHNADILTDLDVEALYRAHQDAGALATLAVRDAVSDRYLLFDDDGLYGWAYRGEEHPVRDARGETRRYDFLGVQVIDPALLDRFEEDGKFSIFTTYMRLIRQGERFAAYPVGHVYWNDIGTHEQLESARSDWSD